MTGGEFQKAIIWGAGLGIGFAIAGLFLGIFKKL